MSYQVVVYGSDEVITGVPLAQMQGPGIYTISNAGNVIGFSPLPYPGFVTPFQTIQSIFINVGTYGAPGGGVTDDAPIINSTIAASPIGSTIFFPGNHLVGSTIILLSGRNYLGPTGHCDAQATFYQKNGANLPAVVASSDWYNNATSTGSSLAIRNIVVDANQANNTTSHGIVLMNEFSSIEDCVVRNAPGSGILLTATNRGGTNSSTTNVNNRIINCYIKSCSGYGIWIHDNALNAVTDGYIRDCIIDTATLDSIYLENAAGWFLSGNHVYGCQANGYNLANCYSTFVIGNEVDGYGFGIGSGGYVAGMQIYVIPGRATVVEGNIISNSSESGRSELLRSCCGCRPNRHNEGTRCKQSCARCIYRLEPHSQLGLHYGGVERRNVLCA